VQPSAEESLLVLPLDGGPAWRVRRVVGGQVSAAAPARGGRFAVAVWTRGGATTLFVADAASRRVARLGRVPAGRALWSTDGRVLVWAAATGPWRVYDPVSGRLVMTAPGRGTFAALG
jgi:hypothetical protein